MPTVTTTASKIAISASLISLPSARALPGDAWLRRAEWKLRPPPPDELDEHDWAPSSATQDLIKRYSAAVGKADQHLIDKVKACERSVPVYFINPVFGGMSLEGIGHRVFGCAEQRLCITHAHADVHSRASRSLDCLVGLTCCQR